MTASPPWAAFLPAGVSADFAPVPTTLSAQLATSVDAYAARGAIEYYGETLTYGALGAKVAAVAAALRAHGVAPGDRVALYLPNTPFHPIWFHGILTAGAVVTHFSPLDAPRELAHKAADSGARLIVTLSSAAFAHRALALKADGAVDTVVVCHDPVSLKGEAPVTDGALTHEAFVADHEGEPLAFYPAAPQDLALLQYTGGTTGVPKAAMLTHANITAAIDIYREWFRGTPQTGPDNAVLTYAPLFHILGLTTNLLRRLAEGGLVVLRQRFDAAEAVETIERLKITAFGGVPTLWIAVSQLPGIEHRDLSSLTMISSGGAPLSVELYRRVRALTGLSLRGGWGMTETAPAGTFIPADLPEDKLGTIGIPLPGVDIQICDLADPARVLPANTVGEMRIRGPNVTAGYWNRPEETAAAYVGDYLLTGDVAYMDDDGFLFIVDRKKDLIVSSGYNVYPLVIENAIAEHPDVAEVIVIGVPDDYRGEAAKAFVVLRAGAAPFPLADLHAFLAERIGRHELPRDMEFRAELPRTSVGKHSRRELRAQEEARTGASLLGGAGAEA